MLEHFINDKDAQIKALTAENERLRAIIEQDNVEPVAYLSFYSIGDGEDRQEGCEVCHKLDVNAFPVYTRPSNYEGSIGHIGVNTGHWYGVIDLEALEQKRVKVGDKLFLHPPKDSTEPASKDYHVISDSSDGVIALSRTVAGQLIYLREELAKGDINEAYHALYSIADPTFTSLEPWKRLEEIAAAPTTPKGE